MDSGDQALLRGDAPEESRKLLPFGCIKRGAEVVLVLPRDVSDLLERLAPRIGQVQRVRTTVARPVPALDQLALLQLVKQRDETTREGPKRLAQRLLAEAVGPVERPEDAGVRRLES
jgi:hypothetical protein